MEYSYATVEYILDVSSATPETRDPDTSLVLKERGERHNEDFSVDVRSYKDSVRANQFDGPKKRGMGSLENKTQIVLYDYRGSELK